MIRKDDPPLPAYKKATKPKSNFSESRLSKRWHPMLEFIPPNDFEYRIIPYHRAMAINFIHKTLGHDFLTVIEKYAPEERYVELTRLRCVDLQENMKRTANDKH